jgi:putative effector of murein hydrolase
MPGSYFSPKGFIIFILFVAGFAAAVAMDQGSGPLSKAWPFLILGLLIGATLAIYSHMWIERRDFEKIRRIESQSLYGVLPKRVREWLFP